MFTLTQPSLAFGDDTFPVRRIFCIGRNYADHAAEMGAVADRETPLYFTKSAYALATGPEIPFPPATTDLHHEVEMVLALGRPLRNATPAEAAAAVIARAVGLDLTRRDLQAIAKEKRAPWDAGKDFDNSAVIGPLSNAAPGPGIRLMVNGQMRQNGDLAQMIFGEGEILAYLSTLHHLQPGDLVMTGTPAGVSALQPGDRLRAEIDGLPSLDLHITS